MINAILFKEGKIAFQVLLIVLFQWSTTICQLNLYDTNRKSNPLQFDCLNYRIRRKTLAYQDSKKDCAEGDDEDENLCRVSILVTQVSFFFFLM
jgi:hypothetical protein